MVLLAMAVLSVTACLVAEVAAVSGSDQRPRFHFMPKHAYTNDIQGPFYDPHHQLYHMGFAWHVNATHAAAGNRWYHIVSRDLAHWQVVSTTPDLAMLKPDQPYDNVAVMTGSVTLVNGVPTALYACRGNATDNKQVMALATAANLSDPLVTEWRKYSKNPVSTGDTTTGNFRDPSTAWQSGGKWVTLLACQLCNGTDSMLGLYSSTDFQVWVLESIPLDIPQLECPDYWPILTVDGSPSSLSAIKVSVALKEMVYVGTWNEQTQRLENIVTPLLPTTPYQPNGTQLLDASTYASKSFYDPVNKQQVWSSWVLEGLRDPVTKVCLNASVCGTHTLPRSLLYDPSIRAHITPPVPQVSLLRGAPLPTGLAVPLRLTPGTQYPLAAEVAKSGMQLEIHATFELPLPLGTTVGVVVRRGRGQSTQTYLTNMTRGKYNSSLAVQPMGLTTTVLNLNDLIAGRPIQSYGEEIRFPIKRTDANVTLRIFVDHSVIEAYAQGGRGVATTRTYPTDDALGVGIVCNSTGDQCPTLLELQVWPVEDMWVETLP